MIVAIDGPAGSGKSTIAKLVAKRLGYLFLNSGRLYRMITLLIIEEGIKIDEKSIQDLLPIEGIELSQDHVLVGSRSFSEELHTPIIDKYVPIVSSFPSVRSQVNQILVITSQDHDVVVEGRDMTTVVFPHAEHKFFLDASISARAQRRFEQGISKQNFEEIYSAIEERDAIDRKKTLGALTLSEDAEYLDTSGLTIEQVCEKVVKSIQGHKTHQELL
jgi:cytidylate kinase